MVTAVGLPARHVGGEARTGQHGGDGLRRDLGDDLREAHVGVAFEALGGDDERRAGRDIGRGGGGDGAHGLGRHGEHDGVGAERDAERIGRRDVGEIDAGQIARVLVALVDGVNRGAVARPDAHRAAGAGGGQCQRGAPGAAADDADGLDHARAPFAPLPSLGAASSSSGQRGRAATSRESVRPRASRSAPAQAIITALSEHRRGGGATRRKP